MRMKILLGAFSALALAAAIPAHAAQILLNFDAAGTSSDVSALIDVSDTANGDGSFNITGISGLVGGDAITGLVDDPSSPTAILSLDGRFIFDNAFRYSAPALSNPGLLFTDAGHVNNLYSNSATSFSLIRDPGDWPDGVTGEFSATVTRVAGVPEPASWAMMIMGIGGIGGMIRRRRRATPELALG